MRITKHAPERFPDIQITKPEVFILESLSFRDEEAGRYEGKILCDILRMCGKEPLYYYFRTEEELVELVKMFRNSAYRYLHLSCHGGAASVSTTLGEIPYRRFAEIVQGHLKNRRMFLSACSVGNEMFAVVVNGRNRGMYSIAGPADDIEFRHAAALWGAFYVRAFSVSERGIKNKEIRNSLVQICGLFEIRFFWAWHDARNNEFKHEIIGKRGRSIV